MISLSQFVGALLEGTVNGRAKSDVASVRLAEAYLKHELLKVFPVPRMQIQDVEIDLQFAIDPNLPPNTLFAEEEVRKNICYKIQHFLLGLPQDKEMKEFFSQDEELAKTWNSKLTQLMQRIEQLLNRQNLDKATLLHLLNLAIENFFHEVAFARPKPNLLSFISSIFHHSSTQKPTSSLKDRIIAYVQQVIDAAISDRPISIAAAKNAAAKDAAAEPADTDADTDIDADLPDLQVLIKASDLEGLTPSQIQKLKLVLHASDRKWIKLDKQGEEEYILDRS